MSRPPCGMVAFVGHRPPPSADYWSWEESQEAQALTTEIVCGFDPEQHVIVSGGAEGVDTWAAMAARGRRMGLVEMRPRWKAGRWAGLERNDWIIRWLLAGAGAPSLIAVWTGLARSGTAYTVRRAREAGIDVFEYRIP